ncbi:hypothetical protein FBY03_10699 [Pseudomonas sp. SJZ079]|uniref:hypothetical protein n=1 Tax=Pseudomonas sp. SJZ079 TaxID=2572887 RepID=UPI0011992230|nr:hypothetical protein [Pseudomonas sp. SJZ079]TWC38602.1 hypothetical protein FBY03_10699 [Pseudomonas sp. SJZ079]
MASQDQPGPVTDEAVLASVQRKLRSARVKPAVPVVLTQKTYPDVSRKRIVHRFKRLDSSLFKR